jgi:ADP-ribosylglycohydrolase
LKRKPVGKRTRWTRRLPQSQQDHSKRKNRRKSKVPATLSNRWKRLSGAFDRSRSFREGALLAVNLSNDADTTAAIYGQLAGAFYGGQQIPPEWKTKLIMHDFIVETADRLVNLGFLSPAIASARR